MNFLTAFFLSYYNGLIVITITVAIITISFIIIIIIVNITIITIGFIIIIYKKVSNKINSSR